MPFETLFWLGPVTAGAALATALVQFLRLKRLPPVSLELRDRSAALKKGVSAFWRRLFQVALPLYLALAGLLALMQLLGWLPCTVAPLAFGAGGALGALASGIASSVTLRCSTRLLPALEQSTEDAFHAALRGGMVASFSCVGLALLPLSAYPLVLIRLTGADPTQAGLSLRFLVLGALLWMLLSQFGGSVFARSARATSGDLAVQERALLTDLTGRSGATAAGLSGQLLAGLLSSVLAAYVLGSYVFLEDGAAWNALCLPLVLLCVGTLCSLFGILVLHYEQRTSLHRSLLKATAVATTLTAALSAPITYLFLGSWRFYLALLAGILAGGLLPLSTRHFLADPRRTHRSLGTAARSGALPLAVLFATVLLSYLLTRSTYGSVSPLRGAYGVALAGVGFFSPLSLSLSVAASSPTCDTLAALVTALPCDETLQARCDALQARSSTSASHGRAYALGGSFLAGLGLTGACAYPLVRSGTSLLGLPFWVGMVLGFLMASTLSSLTLTAGYTTVRLLRAEYRRNGKRSAKSLATCVDLGLRSALSDTALPTLSLGLTTLLTGWLLGTRGVVGLLLGSTLFGCVLAVLLPGTRFLWPWSKAPNGRASTLPLRRISGSILTSLLLLAACVALGLAAVGQ